MVAAKATHQRPHFMQSTSSPPHAPMALHTHTATHTLPHAPATCHDELVGAPLHYQPCVGKACYPYAIHRSPAPTTPPRAPVTTSSLVGRDASALLMRVCRQSGRILCETETHVLGDTLGMMKACSSPLCPSRTLNLTLMRLVASWHLGLGGI